MLRFNEPAVLQRLDQTVIDERLRIGGLGLSIVKVFRKGNVSTAEILKLPAEERPTSDPVDLGEIAYDVIRRTVGLAAPTCKKKS
jgi:hypothetical protein